MTVKTAVIGLGNQAAQRVDPQWWEQGWFDGRPMSRILAERDMRRVFGFLRSRGWSQAAIAAATGLTENRVRAVAQGRQQITTYQVLERVVENLGIRRGAVGLAYDRDVSVQA